MSVWIVERWHMIEDGAGAWVFVGVAEDYEAALDLSHKAPPSVNGPPAFRSRKVLTGVPVDYEE